MDASHDSQRSLDLLRRMRIAVLGYGNQGRAHALNLRDSGADVAVGQRAGSARFDAAVADGFAPRSLVEAAGGADLLVFALPDDRMADIYRGQVLPHLRGGQALGFIHGFNIHFGLIQPPPDVDVVMVAPKGPGRLVRSAFASGDGVAALLAVQRDATGRARDTARAWAAGIGAARRGILETTFAAETVTDLFGEQTVLCGGMIELMKAAFETLADAGYAEELAYFECIHEVKQIVDLIYEEGIEGMRARISSTARYGGLVRGPQMVPPQVRRAMREALGDIERGDFARRFIADTQAGGPEMARLAAAERAHRAPAAGRRLLDWLRTRGGADGAGA